MQESTPIALTPREIERESEKDPELSSVRYYVQTGDWSQCKMPSYLCVKNELCVIGKLLLRGDNCNTEELTENSTRVSSRGTPGHRKNEKSVAHKGMVAEIRG